MDSGLSQLVAEYIASVDAALTKLERAGVRRPSSQLDWVTSAPRMRDLGDGMFFRKHGVGCRVDLAGGAVDFDFGPNGETPTLDVWRLIEFANSRLADYGFSSENEVVAAFQSSIASGELISLGYANLYRRSSDAV